MKIWNLFRPSRCWNQFFFTNSWVGWVGQSNLEWNYYLQCKQFQFVGRVRWAVFRELSKYFADNRVSPLPTPGKNWSVRLWLTGSYCLLPLRINGIKFRKNLRRITRYTVAVSRFIDAFSSLSDAVRWLTGNASGL